VKSDMEFFKGEYQSCVRKLLASKPMSARQRIFYSRLGASMHRAYKEAKNVGVSVN
jgi:hypothetical protein